MFKLSSVSTFMTAACFLGGLVLRSAMVRQPHSGQGRSPMFGDYEAQRHWMEVTVNLPVRSWYRHSELNDLQYWGLDYPPLTAYHSLLMGKVAARVNSSWVALHSSRGEESTAHKTFMRRTVVFADAVIFLPACLLWALWAMGVQSQMTIAFVLVMLVSYPGLILIDHGHFQYNGVSLGLFLASVASLHRQHDVLASVLFCCALAYKQMLLFFALPIFFFLLGKCLNLGFRAGLAKLLALGLTVAATFAAIFAPFLSSWDDLSAVIQRLFPLGRGLYENIVANVWCSLSVVLKLRQILSQQQLVALCIGVILLAHVPIAWLLLWRRPGSLRGLRTALAISSIAFFLFSYQVHEKSVLMPGLAVLLLAAEQPWTALHFSLVSTASMWPLLTKDGLALATAALCLLHVCVAMPLCPGRSPGPTGKTLYALSLSGFLTLIGCGVFLPAPKSLPYIHALFVSMYSCGHFLLFLLHFYASLVIDVGGVGAGRKKKRL